MKALKNNGKLLIAEQVVGWGLVVFFTCKFLGV